MNGPLFSLVLPTYNPGPVLDHTWRQIVDFLKTSPRRWEVLFVCDGCRDGSDQRLAELTAKTDLPIRVLRSPSNRGKGHAVRRGLLRARGDFRIFTDVDLAYPLEMVEAMADQLADGHNIVVASRAHEESDVRHRAGLDRYLRRRKFQSAVFSAVARTLLGFRSRDPQAGLKGFSAQAVRTILPYVKCQGFGFDCELLVAARYFGISVLEMPVRVVYENTNTTTHLTSASAMLNELLAIRRHWRRIARQGLDRSILVHAADLDAARRYRERRAQRMQRRAAAHD